MAQYDLQLTQNVSSGGIEFSEKIVNISKGGLLSADTNKTPTILPAGTNGYMLVRDDAETTGLKWVAISAGHTQNTDTGTTNSTFTIDSDTTTGKLILQAIAGSGDYALTLKNAQLTADREIIFPDLGGTVALTSQLPSNPLLFKGSIDCSTNPNYPAATVGDLYVVSVAGKIGGASGVNVEAGDTLYCKTNTAAGDEATVGVNWIIVQKNLDGAVIGPSSATDGNICKFNGATGKLIADTGLSTTDVSSAISLKHDAVTIATNGGIQLSGQELNLWVSAPAAKNSTGVKGTFAYADNYLYICTDTNTWKRIAIATNW
jgi:hypothetical protein